MNEIIDQYVELFTRELSDTSPAGIGRLLRDLTDQGLLSGSIAAQVAQHFAVSWEDQVMESHEPPSAAASLEIDWGVEPQVGRELRPHFRLRTGASRCLGVAVLIDSRLDHEPEASWPRVQSGEPDEVEFCAAFRTTTQGQPCLPGQYTIDIFGLLQSPETNHCEMVHGLVRLIVSVSGEAAPVLEIDSGEQALINLQGLDLARFSKVVARAGTTGLINVVAHPTSPSSPNAAKGSLLKSTPAEPGPGCRMRTFSFPSHPIPQQVVNEDVPPLERAMWLFETGERQLLIPWTTPDRHLKWGRDRWPTNDLTLRYWPRTAIHDVQSLQISRTHFSLSLRAEGLWLIDHSGQGVVVAGQRVTEMELRRPLATWGEVHLAIGGGGSHPPLELGLVASANGSADRRETELRQRFLARLLGCDQPPEIWGWSAGLGLAAVAIQRRNNMPAESYLVLLEYADFARETATGRLTFTTTAAEAVVRLRHARNRFWLERANESVPVLVDGGEVPFRAVVGLRPGCGVQVGEVLARFEPAGQMGLE